MNVSDSWRVGLKSVVLVVYTSILWSFEFDEIRRSQASDMPLLRFCYARKSFYTYCLLRVLLVREFWFRDGGRSRHQFDSVDFEFRTQVRWITLVMSDYLKG